jgi:hypothetical protein
VEGLEDIPGGDIVYLVIMDEDDSNETPNYDKYVSLSCQLGWYNTDFPPYSITFNSESVVLVESRVTEGFPAGGSVFSESSVHLPKEDEEDANERHKIRMCAYI